jgi:tRNA(Ile)-lysidine synthase
VNPSDPAKALAAHLDTHVAGGTVGVAVSGGSDSRALLVLAADCLGAARLHAATVDHGLRPEAAEEAKRVAQLCDQLGIAHVTLNWRWDGQGNLQEAARLGRRHALARWAQERGLAAVLLGHTRDDQAETVLMALARGAGVNGLSAMPERLDAAGMLWLRPFLGTSRACLRKVLEARGIGWDDDPGNQDHRFERVRMRALLAEAGIDAEALASLATRMQSVRNALESARIEAQRTLVSEDRGTLVIADAPLPAEVRSRLFLHLLAALTGGGEPPRRAALERWLAQGGPLHGCILHREPGGWRLFREPHAVAGQSVPACDVWDWRWRAQGPVDAPSKARIAALGAAGLARLSQQSHADLHPHWREAGLPEGALAGLPAIWEGDTLLAAPLAGWPNGWRLTAAPVPVTELSH